MEKEQTPSFGETSETTECPRCLESGLAITDVSFGNPVFAAIRRASSPKVLE
jgi:hypothetical protein